jgi:hypothetical protein
MPRRNPEYVRRAVEQFEANVAALRAALRGAALRAAVMEQRRALAAIVTAHR